MKISRLSIAVVLAAALGLGACAQDGSINNTGKGAAIGGLGGGALGALVGKGDRTTGGLVGAGIGAIAGAAVGAYMDSQEQKLRQDLQGSGAELVRQGDSIVINIPNNVTFAFDSSDLKPQAQASLGDVATTLAQNPQTMIRITGHTDSVGSEDYNIDLSLRRAESVMNYLVSRGVVRQRVEASGAGESRPIASNETEQGRAQNRRVEMRIDPVVAN